MACYSLYGMFSVYMEFFRFIWHVLSYMAHFQFIWHVFSLYGMLSVCMACYQFIWHVFSLYGMFSVFMAYFQFIWHVSVYMASVSLYGMFSVYMACFQVMWHGLFRPKKCILSPTKWIQGIFLVKTHFQGLKRQFRNKLKKTKMPGSKSWRKESGV